MHVPVFLMCRNAGDGASRSDGNLCMCKDAPSTMCMCMGVHPEKRQLAVHGPGIGEQQPAGALSNSQHERWHNVHLHAYGESR